MAKTYALGLNYQWPVQNEAGGSWYQYVDAALTSISGHTHDGAGGGAQLTGSSIANSSIGAAQIRLANAAWLVARNAANSADVNLLRLSATDRLEVSPAVVFSSPEQLSGSGAISLQTVLTAVSSASANAMTLAAGTSGQIKIILNLFTGPTTITPSIAANNTVLLGQDGAVVYVFGTKWYPVAIINGIITNDTVSQQSFAAAGTYNGFAKTVVCTGTTYTITTPAGVVGQTVAVSNNASGAVTFGGFAMATGTYYQFTYLNGAWRRVQLT
jgi:hypothetical protein